MHAVTTRARRCERARPWEPPLQVPTQAVWAVFPGAWVGARRLGLLEPAQPAAARSGRSRRTAARPELLALYMRRSASATSASGP